MSSTFLLFLLLPFTTFGAEFNPILSLPHHTSLFLLLLLSPISWTIPGVGNLLSVFPNHCNIGWCGGVNLARTSASACTCGSLRTRYMPLQPERISSSADEAAASTSSKSAGAGLACKYYLSGCCTKGVNCAYLHDFQAPSSQLCTHYLRGSCAYGSRCRYLHSKAARNREIPAAQPPKPAMEQKTTAPEAQATQNTAAPNVSTKKETVWDVPTGTAQETAEGKKKKPACAMEAAGRCARGDRCPFSHQAEDLQELQKLLGKNWRFGQVEDLERDQELKAKANNPPDGKSKSLAQEDGVPCGICLDVPEDNRYGLLNCNHAFCLKCIRSWRASRAKEEDNEGKAMARACPMCRVETHLIVPSIGWPTDPAEREATAQRYKEKLASTDCSHFNFGDGECPFGTSCLYRHQYRDGTLDERKLRARMGADGNLEVVTPVKLSSFLDL